MRRHRELSEDEEGYLRAIGALMQGARRPRGQRRVAADVNTSQTRISRWESGAAVPDVIDLIRFALACGSRPERLIAGVATPTVEQLHRELDARAGAAVEEIVELLRDRTRPPLRTPGTGEDRTA